MGSSRSLTAWGKHGRFGYVGSVELGTRIILGRGKETVVDASLYRELLTHFARRTVPIGASRHPPRDSLGGWLQPRSGTEVLAAYVGPILVKEGYAERVGEDALHVRGALTPPE